jgi:hypothetical protein
MPIRLNLLAEAQAAEELRRKDPVKRAVWLGVLLVAGMLVWSSSIYVTTLMANSELSGREGAISQRSDKYDEIVEQQARVTEMHHKFNKLDELATNRFLNGNLLNALQQVSVADVQLMRIRVDQQYNLTPEVKAQTNKQGKVTKAGVPAAIRENILVQIEARDASANPGDQVNKYKDILSTNDYFATTLSKSNGVRLAFVGNLTALPETKAFKLFTVECRYPEHTR